MATLGRSGDVALAERFARALAAELRAVGITLDYAPVLDIHTNPKNPVIGDRALAEKAEEVARLGAAIVRALQAEGVAACGKHFPGPRRHQHRFAPRAAARRASARAAARGRVRAVQGGDRGRRRDHHDRARPGAVARREAAGDAVAAGSSPTCCATSCSYEGVILSDDLEMKAIAERLRGAGGRGAGDRSGLRRRADLQRRSRRRRRRRSRRWSTRSRSERLPLDARRGRAEAAAARQGAVPRVAGRAAAARAARRCATALGRDEHRAIADEMARFAVMRKPRALAPGDRLAVVAPGQPVQPRRVRSRHRRDPRASGSSRSTTNRCSRGSATSPGRPTCARRRSDAAWRDPSIAGLIGVRGGYGSAQVLPLLDRDEARRAAQAVHRLQRSHGAAHVSDDRLRPGRLPRADAGRPARRGAPTATIATRSIRALCRREPMGELAPPGSRRFDRGEARGPAARRHADAAARVARHAVRVRAAAGLRAVSRRGRRAAVSARSHGDAAARRPACSRAPRPSSSASCRAATSRRATRRRAR